MRQPVLSVFVKKYRSIGCNNRAGINPAPTAIPAIPHEQGKPGGAIFCASAQFLFYALRAILREAIFGMGRLDTRRG